MLAPVQLLAALRWHCSAFLCETKQQAVKKEAFSLLQPLPGSPHGFVQNLWHPAPQALAINYTILYHVQHMGAHVSAHR